MTDFYTLMQQNMAYQRDQLDLSDEQFADLHKDMSAKVDAYHDYMDFLKSESERYKEQAKALTERARVASALRERLLQRASTVLAINDDRDAIGDVWRMCVKPTKFTEIKVIPTYETYSKWGMEYPDLVKVDYSISKSCLKDLLENPDCPAEIRDLGSIEIRKSVTFKPRKVSKAS